MTRYIPVIYDYDNPEAKMHPEPDGDYIKFKDYQTRQGGRPWSR